MQYRFAIFDVFTDKPMAGNQLGVVYGAEALQDEAMQRIAREFNFSETIFLGDALDSAHSARVRIFTPANELPFAGHPTIGAAIAVGLEMGLDAVGQGILMLEENVGPVRCGVRFKNGSAYAEFDLPVLAVEKPADGTREGAAAALGLTVDEIGFENHVHCAFDAGLPYQLVPVKDLAICAKATPQMQFWREGFGTHSHNSAFVYCRDTVGHDNHFHARMFAPDAGIPEDPATGSAVAAFAGAVAKFDELPDGLHTFHIEQGIEMGRPSLITLEIEMENGAISGGRIGGHAVQFASGQLEI